MASTSTTRPDRDTGTKAACSWTRTNRRNLRLQPWAGACNAHMKDDLERQLSTMVCAKDLTLNGAQHEIATDWCAAYKKWFNGRGRGEP